MRHLTAEHLLYIKREYDSLTPKARRILAVLQKGGGAMLRDEIAYGLRQARLYDHDLKLLDKLTMTPFVGVARRRRYHVEMERNPEYRYMVENFRKIYGGNPRKMFWGKSDYIYEYWINDNLRGVLRRLMEV